MTGEGAPGPQRRRYTPIATGAPGDRLADLQRERRRRFRDMVARAIDELPPRFREAIDNVDIVIAGRPSRAGLRRAGLRAGDTLLGLYQGTPLTQRGEGYHLVLPDKITLYRQSIEAACRSDDELVAEVRKTLLHELAHYFGIDDPRLTELGMG